MKFHRTGLWSSTVLWGWRSWLLPTRRSHLMQELQCKTCSDTHEPYVDRTLSTTSASIRRLLPQTDIVFYTHCKTSELHPDFIQSLKCRQHAIYIIHTHLYHIYSHILLTQYSYCTKLKFVKNCFKHICVITFRKIKSWHNNSTHIPYIGFKDIYIYI